MSEFQAPVAQSAASMALLSLPSSSDDRRKMFEDLFERTNRERELVRKAREEAKAYASKKMMGERFDIDPVAVQIIMRLHNMPAPRRAKVWYQVQIIANDVGLDTDVAVEPHDETGPVFDRSKTAQRQGGDAYGPQGVSRARGESSNVTRTRVNLRMAEEMLERGRHGLPMRHRVGRPSNEERAAQAHAEAKLAEEQEIARQQEADRAQIGYQAEPQLVQQGDEQIEQHEQDDGSRRAIDLGE